MSMYVKLNAAQLSLGFDAALDMSTISVSWHSIAANSLLFLSVNATAVSGSNRT